MVSLNPIRANPGKFQFMVLGTGKLFTDGVKVSFFKEVKLLGNYWQSTQN